MISFRNPLICYWPPPLRYGSMPIPMALIICCIAYLISWNSVVGYWQRHKITLWPTSSCRPLRHQDNSRTPPICWMQSGNSWNAFGGCLQTSAISGGYGGLWASRWQHCCWITCPTFQRDQFSSVFNSWESSVCKTLPVFPQSPQSPQSP
jgi:hypothetical protein